MRKKAGKLSAFILALAVLAGCGEDSGDHVAITGGGFIFNYRIAEAYYSLVAAVRRPVPAGTLVVAEFEDPAGGPAIVVEKTAREGQTRFDLDSPPVTGIASDRPYKVVLRLESPTGEVIETHEKTFTSNVDQAVMPLKPLTVGPGYTKNPDAAQ